VLATVAPTTFGAFAVRLHDAAKASLTVPLRAHTLSCRLSFKGGYFQFQTMRTP